MREKFLSVLKYLPIVLLIIHCVVIFNFSAQSATESTETSTKTVEQVLDVINGDKEVTKEEVKKAEPVARSIAHFMLFLVLGVLTALVLRNVEDFPRLFAVLSFCVLYAFVDEFHQTFSPGRSFEFEDILVDFAGSACGFLIYFAVQKIWRKIG
ncbi:MAG: VanZ family protein [Clostridia bacterium]|nr:VanZ family protein [Clostridia bacterium]